MVNLKSSHLEVNLFWEFTKKQPHFALSEAAFQTTTLKKFYK